MPTLGMLCAASAPRARFPHSWAPTPPRPVTRVLPEAHVLAPALPSFARLARGPLAMQPLARCVPTARMRLTAAALHLRFVYRASRGHSLQGRVPRLVPPANRAHTAPQVLCACRAMKEATPTQWLPRLVMCASPAPPAISAAGAPLLLLLVGQAHTLSTALRSAPRAPLGLFRHPAALHRLRARLVRPAWQQAALGPACVPTALRGRTPWEAPPRALRAVQGLTAVALAAPRPPPVSPAPTSHSPRQSAHLPSPAVSCVHLATPLPLAQQYARRVVQGRMRHKRAAAAFPALLAGSVRLWALLCARDCAPRAHIRTRRVHCLQLFA